MLLAAIGHVVKWVGIQICHNSPRAAVTSLLKVRLIPRSFHIGHEWRQLSVSSFLGGSHHFLEFSLFRFLWFLCFLMDYEQKEWSGRREERRKEGRRKGGKWHSNLFSLSEEGGLCDLLHFNHKCSSLSFTLLVFHSPCFLGVSEKHEVDPFQTFLWFLSICAPEDCLSIATSFHIPCRQHHHCHKLVLEWETKD